MLGRSIVIIGRHERTVFSVPVVLLGRAIIGELMCGVGSIVYLGKRGICSVLSLLFYGFRFSERIIE